MRITDIKQQQRRTDRYAVYVDDKYSFSLGESELLSSGISIGLEVSPGRLDELKELAQLDKLYDQSLNYLALRPRSRWELEQYLMRKKSPTPLAEAILNKLSVNGYIDDAEFARAWLNNRRLLKATSRRRLIAELRQKHVVNEVIKEVMEEDEADEQQVLRGLVAKKRTQSKYQDNLKLMQYLSRQGFNYGDIKTVLGEDDNGDDTGPRVL